MDIASLFAELHSLPSVPKVAQDLIQQFDNPATSLESVARNIERDPVIAARCCAWPTRRGSVVRVRPAAWRMRPCVWASTRCVLWYWLQP